MILLPEYREEASSEDTPAMVAGGDPGAAVAAQVPMRAVSRTRVVTAQSSTTAPRPQEAPAPFADTRPRRASAPAPAHPTAGTARSAVRATPLPRPVPTPPAPQVTAAGAASIGQHTAEALALVGGSTRGRTKAATVARPARPARRTVIEHRAPASPARWSFARLPRRGQRLIVGVGFALAIGVGAVVGGFLEPGVDVPAETTLVTVQPGESLWQIAGAAAPAGADLRPTIDRIRELNELTGSTVTDGQQLLVPAASE